MIGARKLFYPLSRLNWPSWVCISALSIALAGVTSDALHSEEAIDAVALELFEKQVRPILVERCIECHSTDESSGGLDLETRAGTQKGGDSGPAIIIGKPGESLLIAAVRYTKQELQMPPKQPISDAEIKVLERWIEAGAPDPRNDAIASAPKPTGMSVEDGREFWSFRPVADPMQPTVHDAAWIRSPVDSFVLAKLEAKGIRPAPEADRHTLIRRVSFDLTGLPPTLEEIDSFVADQSPLAYERVVERFLASPRYGVRWGRHWLDVARYADSNGLDENLAFGTAWRYRDYVIDSFNKDKPFNRFLTEQLAGDLLPDATLETRIATGFLVLGAKVLAEPDRTKLEMDTIDEQIDSMSKAFLGMTWGCVRCHDHKFDPIKQSDYYALAAIFKSTKTFGDTNYGAIKHWNEFVFSTAEEREALKQVEASIAETKAVATKFRSDATEKIRSASRARVTDYLVAAAKLEPNATLTTIEAVAKPLELHPRILKHCRLHLEYHSDDALFAPWHQFVRSGDTASIDRYYRTLFAESAAPPEVATAADPNVKPLVNPLFEAARAALVDPAGLLAIPPQPEFAFDPETLTEYNRLSDLARIAESNAPDESTALAVGDAVVVPSLPIHIRGSHLNLGDAIERDIPAVFRSPDRQEIFPRHQSGRLELADWMANTGHPLTARVLVNRVWRWHMGSGIVASPDNFGALGDRPSHPELLDWLARYFMESGWSIKDLHRIIVLSSTYRMQSSHPDDLNVSSDLSDPSRPSIIDPENRLHWKFNRQRLDAEQLRDSIVGIAGKLDESIGGKTVPLRNRQFVFDHTSIDHTKYESLRRAAYLPVIRNNLYDWFEQFDFPDPTMPTGSRNATTVAPQALQLLNTDLVIRAADQFAVNLSQQFADRDQRIVGAYQAALGRSPSEPELARLRRFLSECGDDTNASLTGAGEQLAWSMLCQSLFASNEFIYVK